MVARNIEFMGIKGGEFTGKKVLIQKPLKLFKRNRIFFLFGPSLVCTHRSALYFLKQHM